MVDGQESVSVGVVGTGYVGLTTGACLAHLGHDVTCADIDEDKVARLNNGEIPILEEGLEDIVRDAVAAGRLRFVTGAANAADAQVVMLCVPTPQDEDGSADLSYLRAAGAEIREVLRPGTVVVNKSTVPVGSAQVMASVLQRDDVYVASNPEFLREGTAVADFLNPDRVVIGATEPEAAAIVARLYASMDTQIVVTDPASAEIIKYAANGFLAMKVSFVNEIASLCELVDADINDVVRGIGLDQRIGSAFLRPGPGWGGSCFPKDSRALVKASSELGYPFELMQEVINANERHQDRMVDKIAYAAGRADADPAGLTVAALGLTFKAHTDDLRESPALAIVERLLRAGATVRGYDPTVPATSTRVAPRHRVLALDGVSTYSSAVEAAEGADVVVILTEWPEFGELDWSAVGERTALQALVDTRNSAHVEDVLAAGFTYDGVGR